MNRQSVLFCSVVSLYCTKKGLFVQYTMLKIPFLHSTVCKLCKIGIRLLNSVKPVGLDRKWYQYGVPVSQSSPQGQQMANSGNTKPPFGRSLFKSLQLGFFGMYNLPLSCFARISADPALAQSLNPHSCKWLRIPSCRRPAPRRACSGAGTLQQKR